MHDWASIDAILQNKEPTDTEKRNLRQKRANNRKERRENYCAARVLQRTLRAWLPVIKKKSHAYTDIVPHSPCPNTQGSRVKLEDEERQLTAAHPEYSRSKAIHDDIDTIFNGTDSQSVLVDFETLGCEDKSTNAFADDGCLSEVSQPTLSNAARCQPNITNTQCETQIAVNDATTIADTYTTSLDSTKTLRETQNPALMSEAHDVSAPKDHMSTQQCEASLLMNRDQSVHNQETNNQPLQPTTMLTFSEPQTTIEVFQTWVTTTSSVSPPSATQSSLSNKITKAAVQATSIVPSDSTVTTSSASGSIGQLHSATQSTHQEPIAASHMNALSIDSPSSTSNNLPPSTLASANDANIPGDFIASSSFLPTILSPDALSAGLPSPSDFSYPDLSNQDLSALEEDFMRQLDSNKMFILDDTNSPSDLASNDNSQSSESIFKHVKTEDTNLDLSSVSEADKTRTQHDSPTSIDQSQRDQSLHARYVSNASSSLSTSVINKSPSNIAWQTSSRHRAASESITDSKQTHGRAHTLSPSRIEAKEQVAKMERQRMQQIRKKARKLAKLKAQQELQQKLEKEEQRQSTEAKRAEQILLEQQRLEKRRRRAEKIRAAREAEARIAIEEEKASKERAQLQMQKRVQDARKALAKRLRDKQMNSVEQSNLKEEEAVQQAFEKARERRNRQLKNAAARANRQTNHTIVGNLTNKMHNKPPSPISPNPLKSSSRDHPAAVADMELQDTPKRGTTGHYQLDTLLPGIRSPACELHFNLPSGSNNNNSDFEFSDEEEETSQSIRLQNRSALSARSSLSEHIPVSEEPSHHVHHMIPLTDTPSNISPYNGNIPKYGWGQIHQTRRQARSPGGNTVDDLLRQYRMEK